MSTYRYSRQTVIAIKRLIRHAEARKGELEARMAELEERIACLDCARQFLVQQEQDDAPRRARTVRVR